MSDSEENRASNAGMSEELAYSSQDLTDVQETTKDLGEPTYTDTDDYLSKQQQQDGNPGIIIDEGKSSGSGSSEFDAHGLIEQNGTSK